MNPSGSSLLRDLRSSPNDDLRFLVEWFTSFFFLSPRDVPSLDGKLPEIKVEPPKPWWADSVQPPEKEDKKPEFAKIEEDTPPPDPTWIIDAITDEKIVEQVDFKGDPREHRIIVIGSMSLVFVITLLARLPISEVLLTTFSVLGLNLLLCFVRYKRDACHDDFDIFKTEAKNFIRQLREHQTLIDSIVAERTALQETHAKAELEITKRRSRVSADLQTELAKLQVDLGSRLQLVNQRRQETKADETVKLNSIQGTLGNEIWVLDRTISDLGRAETDEKDTATRKLQESHIQNRLRSHYVAHSSISGIGPTYKNRLLAAGIVTAADLDWRVGRIDGIGPTRRATLLNWKSTLEAAARQSIPTLSTGDRQAIENKYRAERQRHDGRRLQLQKELNAKIADAREYFDDIRRSLSQEEKQIRAANEDEKNRVQGQYSVQFTSLDADVNRLNIKVAPIIDELSEKLRAAEKQRFVLHWKSEMHKKQGRRFASLRFRDYLHKIVSP